MVLAHHLILTGYGHWLPNDPRGSLSETIAAGKLFAAGDIHYGRKPAEEQPSQQELRTILTQGQADLEHPVMWFDELERDAIASAFAHAVSTHGWTCLACAILQNHAHLVMRRHRDPVETMLRELKISSAAAVTTLDAKWRLHPVWSTRNWKKFIDKPDALTATIRYVEANPEKSKLPPQRFTFVKRRP